MSNNSNPAPIAHSVVAVTNAGIDIYDLYDRTPQVGACPGLTERMPNSSNRHGSHSPSLSMFRLRRAEVSTVVEGLDAIDYAAADGLSLSCSAQSFFSLRFVLSELLAPVREALIEGLLNWLHLPLSFPDQRLSNYLLRWLLAGASGHGGDD